MSLDLKYKNKEGITLQKVLTVVKKSGNPLPKKEIATQVKAKKSIDTLLNKLTDSGMLIKIKEGNKILFSLAEDEITKPEPSKLVEEEKIEEPKSKKKTQKRKVTKAKPQRERSPAEVEQINKETSNVTKDHNIESLVEMEEEQKLHFPSDEIDDAALEVLKNQLESRTGKEVTAILHRRNETPERKKKKDVGTIFEEHKKELDILEEDNPYRFVLNFFTSILNKEFGTPYFRRRDAYVVKSIYNKFKTMCDKVEDYTPDMQHMPFYRVITVSEEDMTVKIYHIDVNRVVRGVHTIFKINPFDKDFLFEPLKRNKI
jgi:predicted transcriptional regulator